MRAAGSRHILWAAVVALGLSLLSASAGAATLTGKVVDAAGQPIAGARVDIASAAPKFGRGIFCPTCYADCAKFTTSTADGSFELAGLSDALQFRVLASAKDRETHITKLVDPVAGPLDIPLADAPQNHPPAWTIHGVVVGEAGEPIAGALVDPIGAEQSGRRWWGRVDGVMPTVTDEAGRFVIYARGGMTGVDLTIEADGLAGTTTELTPVGGAQQRIVVPAGGRVTGTLVDAAGALQANCQIAVVQLNRRAGSHFIQAVAATTDAAGRFELRALPADQEYAVFSPVGQGAGNGRVVATRRFAVGASGSTRDVGKLALQSGITFAGRLATPAGVELPGGVKLSLDRNPAWDLIEIPVDRDGRFELTGLPAETYTVRLTAPGWKLDAKPLQFQGLNEASFGVRLDESLSDLVIPIRPVKSTPTARAAQGAADDADANAAAPTGSNNAASAPPVAAADTLGGGAVEVIRSAEPAPRDGPQLNLAGRVIDEAGEPVPGATVYLRAKIGGTQYINGLSHNRDVLARTTTNRAGRFLLPNIAIPPRLDETISNLALGQPSVELVVVADGYGVSWTDIASLEPAVDLQVALAPAADVTGTIRDGAGQPVADAKVMVRGLSREPSSRFELFQAPNDLNLSLSEIAIATTTDAAGQFTLPYAPPRSNVALGVQARGFAAAPVIVVAAEGGNVAAMRDAIRVWMAQIVAEHGDVPELEIQASPVNLKLAADRTLQVRVVDAAGEPVRGGGVVLIDAEGNMGVEAAVDGDGVALAAPRAIGVHRVVYVADPLDPRLGSVAEVDVPADANETATLELRLPEERWQTGRVVDADTGAGVAGAYVWYASTAPGNLPDVTSTAVSDANGQFRLPVVAGPGRIMIRDNVSGYFSPAANHQGMLGEALVDPATASIDVPQDGEIPPAVIELPRGLVLTGDVKSADGTPTAGAILFAQSDSGFGSAVATTDPAGRFTLSGLSPRAEALVSAVGDSAGGWHSVAGDPDHPWTETRTVELHLTAEIGVTLTGRVLKDGAPALGVRMALYRSAPGARDQTLLFAQIATDNDGRYKVPGLAAGDQYYFVLEPADGSTDPAWMHQMPYVQRVAGQPGDVVELPDVNLLGATQSLAGIVVDPQGEPVAGVTVSTQLASGRSLPRSPGGARPWTTTGADGRFTLTGLPDGELHLMAYLANPAGGPIHFPARVAPTPNQADVRIVLDPRLSAEPPELEVP
jgi:protocatechuate 3,4-dioxygenase beta subunit